MIHSSTQTSSLSVYLSASSQNEVYYTWMNGSLMVLLGKDVFIGSVMVIIGVCLVSAVSGSQTVICGQSGL